MILHEKNGCKASKGVQERNAANDDELVVKDMKAT
jgi:hypothetical protein